MSIKSKRWLLTGASGGIGQAIATVLCKRGDCVLLVGRNARALLSLQQCYPDQLEVCVADIADSAGRDAVMHAMQRYTQWSGVIHAAGISQFAWLEDQSEAQIEAQISINVTAAVLLVRRLLPILQQQPQARLLLLGSTFGALGYPGFSVYCASKFALRGFAQALQRELYGTSVQVQYLAPRATRTALNSPQVIAMNQALGVPMDAPEAVAQAVLEQLDRGQKNRQLGRLENLFVRINALWPAMVDKALAGQHATVQRFAKQ